MATQEDFWRLYNKFFLVIPKEGEVNSHIYLIKESTEYINYAPDQEEIQALLDEIAELREENLGLYQDLANQANALGNPSDEENQVVFASTTGNQDFISE